MTARRSRPLSLFVRCSDNDSGSTHKGNRSKEVRFQLRWNPPVKNTSCPVLKKRKRSFHLIKNESNLKKNHSLGKEAGLSQFMFSNACSVPGLGPNRHNTRRRWKFGG